VIRLSAHGKAKPKAPGDERVIRTRTPKPTDRLYARFASLVLAAQLQAESWMMPPRAIWKSGLEDGAQQRRAIVSDCEPGSDFGWNSLSDTA
jgi:hypothetical protein